MLVRCEGDVQLNGKLNGRWSLRACSAGWGADPPPQASLASRWLEVSFEFAHCPGLS